MRGARCTRGCELEGEEEDGGGALGDASGCVSRLMPTAESILSSRILNGRGGWGMDLVNDFCCCCRCMNDFFVMD